MQNICPLTGKPCSHPKNIHVTDIQKDKTVTSLSLCHVCAASYLNALPSTPNTATETLKEVFELFNTFVQAAEIYKKSPMATKPTPKCSKCGITIQEILANGRLGCPACYDNFQFEGLIQNLQGGAKTHVGKVPNQWKNKQQSSLKEKKRKVPIELRIKGLELRMDAMIAEERYEIAASLKKTRSKMLGLKSEIDLLKAAMQSAAQQKDKTHMEEIKSKINAIMDECAEIELSVVRSMK